MKNNITMQVIADSAGVSKMAVSLALRNHPSVTRQTRDRIRETANALGYRPNPLLSRLMTQIRTSHEKREAISIAFLNDFLEPDLRSRAKLLRDFHEGAVFRADQLGLTIYEFPPFRTPEEGEARRRKLLNVGVDGVLIFPSNQSAGLSSLDWNRYPSVTLGYRSPSLGSQRVYCDYFRNSHMALERLDKCGRRRIGFIDTNSDHERTMGELFGGYFSAGFLHPRLQIATPESNSKWTVKTILSYIKRNRCDGLIVTPRFPFKEIEMAGIRIPDDLAVAMSGLDLEDIREGVAGIDNQHRLAGSKSVDLLRAKILAHERDMLEVPTALLVPGVWVNGWTCPIPI